MSIAERETTPQERLEEVLNDTGAPKAVLEGRPWQITDAGSAEWALRKRAQVAGQIQQVESLVNEQIQVLEEFRTREMERLTPNLEHWDSLLGRYHRQILSEDGEAKTLHFPHGTLTARKLPDNVEIEDPAALLAWARENAKEFVRTKIELDRSAVKQAVLKSGEVLPGVAPVVGEIRFTVSTEAVEG